MSDQNREDPKSAFMHPAPHTSSDMERIAAKAGVDLGGNTISAEQRFDILRRHRVDGLRNAGGEKGINPKDKIGASKLNLTLLMTSAKIQWALAQMDGATKYGPYNWRVEPVEIMTYLGAAERHLDSFKEGESHAKDSLVHHLGHVMACCAIIIDAMEMGTYIDNRPIPMPNRTNQIDDANAFIKEDKPVGWGR